MALYNIIRFYKDSSHPNHREVIDSGLTLEEAKEHCNDPETCEEGVYFDGFEKIDIDDNINDYVYDVDYDSWDS